MLPAISRTTGDTEMSIISTFEVDNSAALAKRFAYLAAGYLESPSTARKESAQVALENLYRLLEMFRYDSFEDESRRGVLAFEGLESNAKASFRATSWHSSIESALRKSLDEAFGHVQKDVAIDQLQACLRSLVKGEPLQADAAQRAKGFLSAFETSV